MKVKKKQKIDQEYIDFINKVAEAETYNKIYYEKNKEKMRKYQRKYLQEIRKGVRKPKRRNDINNCLKFIRKPIIITFD